MTSSGSQPGTATHAGDRLVLNVTSDPANLGPVRRACEAFCRRQGLDEAAAGDVGLCVNEAMANVTRHAYGGATDRPVAVVAEAVDAIGSAVPDGSPAARSVRIVMRDWGNGVNPLMLPPKPPDPLQPGGLGLVCLRRLIDELAFEPQPDGMRLVMVKRKK
jgi:anti-sigma regulatory factor (Ser/Thr protein kinase)